MTTDVFLIGDTHFGHAALLDRLTRADGRPERFEFTSVFDMDEALVDRWNAVVRPHDVVYHLGDVAMNLRALQAVLRLNGRKFLVQGNHDTLHSKEYYAVGFERIMATVKLADRLLLSHVPLHASSVRPRFEANIHGHLHSTPSPDGPYLNLSAEQINYTPVSLDDVLMRVSQIP